VDYIFRWLGSRFLPGEDRAALGLQERSQVVTDAPVAFGASALKPRADEGITAQSEAIVHAPAAAAAPVPAPSPASGDSVKGSAAPAASSPVPVSVARGEMATIATNGAGNGHAAGGSKNGGAASLGGISLGGVSLGGGTKVAFAAQADAPSCAECGSIMIRNGSCYKCLNCGSTSGCS